MTQRRGSGPDALTGLDRVWPVPDAQVASGRIPGYVAAVRVGGQVAVRAGGRVAAGAESAPMRDDTLFRIASVTKPIGGALALSLVQDGVLTLDDPVARWLPEAASPRVLVSPGAPLDHTTEVTRPITAAVPISGSITMSAMSSPTTTSGGTKPRQKSSIRSPFFAR